MSNPQTRRIRPPRPRKRTSTRTWASCKTFARTIWTRMRPWSRDAATRSSRRCTTTSLRPCQRPSEWRSSCHTQLCSHVEAISDRTKKKDIFKIIGPRLHVMSFIYKYKTYTTYLLYETMHRFILLNKWCSWVQSALRVIRVKSSKLVKCFISGIQVSLNCAFKKCHWCVALKAHLLLLCFSEIHLN